MQLCKDRGWNVDSVLFPVECILKSYHIEVQAYHGGDFNGVSCHRIPDNVEKIMQEIKEAVKSGREKTNNISDTEILSKLEKYKELLKVLTKSGSCQIT